MDFSEEAERAFDLMLAPTSLREVTTLYQAFVG